MVQHEGQKVSASILSESKRSSDREVLEKLGGTVVGELGGMVVRDAR
jgi:hypothetical protein